MQILYENFQKNSDKSTSLQTAIDTAIREAEMLNINTAFIGYCTRDIYKRSKAYKTAIKEGFIYSSTDEGNDVDNMVCCIEREYNNPICFYIVILAHEESFKFVIFWQKVYSIVKYKLSKFRKKVLVLGHDHREWKNKSNHLLLKSLGFDEVLAPKALGFGVETTVFD